MDGSKLRRYINEAGQFKASIADSTAIGRAYFEGGPVHPLGLDFGIQAMTAACLLTANLIKTEGTLMLKIKGAQSGAVILAEANTNGETRCMSSGLPAQIPSGPGSLFQQVVGGGTLTVIRKEAGSRHDFSSVVELVNGGMAINIANYLWQSEQIPSAIQLNSVLDPNHGIASAGGVFIQALPQAKDEVITILEDRLSHGPKAGIAEIDSMAAWLFDGFETKTLTTQAIRYHCNCSRQRMLKVFASLPADELRQMADENKTQEITCSFCQKSYQISASEIQAMATL